MSIKSRDENKVPFLSMQTCPTINLGEQKILLFACLFLPWNVVLRRVDSEYGRENHRYPPAGCSKLCCHTDPGCHPWGASCSSSGKGNAMPACPSAQPLLCTPPNCTLNPAAPVHHLNPCTNCTRAPTAHSGTQWHPHTQWHPASPVHWHQTPGCTPTPAKAFPGIQLWP